MKQGLIMEGGGMSGVFTAGVMDVLMQNDIRFDGAVGVSAGAIFGSNIKSGQIGRVIRFNKRYCQDSRYCSMKSFITTGDIFGADFCYRQLTYELDHLIIRPLKLIQWNFILLQLILKPEKQSTIDVITDCPVICYG